MKSCKTPLVREMAFLTRNLSLVCLLAFSSTTALAGPVGLASGFEDDDGDLASLFDTDWNDFGASTASPLLNWDPPPAAPYREADTLLEGWTFKGLEDAEETTSDTAFAGGVKQDDNCAKLKDAKAPNKDDLKRIYLSTKNLGGSTYLNLAWVRIPQNTTSASAHVGFEFNQADPDNGGGPCADSNLVNRMVGDVLFVYDFEGGQADPVITMRRWIDENYATDDDQNGNNTGIAFWTDEFSPCDIDSSSPPCWGDARDLTQLGFAEAAVNRGFTVSDEIGPTGADEDLEDSEFGEGGIDLTAAGVFPEGQCTSFGKAFGVSRSSGSSGKAQMKDLVGPADFTLSNCATVTIHKVTDPSGDTTNAFTFSTDIKRDNNQSVSDFDLKDGDGGKQITLVDPGTYTVTESDPSSKGYRLTDISCTGLDAANYSVDKSARDVDFTIASGESLDCTFKNAKNPSIVYEKITEGGDGKTPFVFTGTNGVGNDTLTPTDDGEAGKDTSGPHTVTSVALDATIAETVPSGWSFKSVSCKTASSGDLASVNGSTATISAANLLANSGETITCTFTNVKLGDLTLTKAVVNMCGNDNGSFDLYITDGSGPLKSGTVDYQGGSINQPDLLPGDYGVSESGFTTTNYMSTMSGDCSGTTSDTVTVSSDSKTCTITNVRKPTVKVIKHLDDGSLTAFDVLFDVDGSSGTDDTDTVSALVPDSQVHLISGYDAGTGYFGPVTLTEVDHNGVSLNGYSAHWRCNNAVFNSNDTDSVSEDDTPTITIDNVQPGEAIVCDLYNIPNAAAACQ